MFLFQSLGSSNRQSQRRKASIPSCVLLLVFLIQFVICGSTVERLATTVNLFIPYCKMSLCLTGVKPTAHRWDMNQCSGTRTLVSVMESKLISCPPWSSVFKGFGVDIVQEMKEVGFETRTWLLCADSVASYTVSKTLSPNPPKPKKLKKKNPEAGDLLPYSFKTSIPHSNAIKISSQIKEARHLYAESDHMQVSFLQENKIRQPNTPCDRLVLFLTRFKVGRPLVPRREAVMHIESAKGCQPRSRPGTKFYLSQIQHRFKLRRFTENNLFSPPFRECLFPTCLCPLPSYP